MSARSISTHYLLVIAMILRTCSLVNAGLLDAETSAFWLLSLLDDGLEYLEIYYFYVVVFKHTHSQLLLTGPLRIKLLQLISRITQYLTLSSCSQSLFDVSFDPIKRQLSRRNRFPAFLSSNPILSFKKLSYSTIHTTNHRNLLVKHTISPAPIKTDLNRMLSMKSLPSIALIAYHKNKIMTTYITLNHKDCIILFKIQLVYSLFLKMKKNSARKPAIAEELIQLILRDHELNQKEQHYYNVVTGNYKYLATPWTQEDLEPDLVLTIKLPKDENIDRIKFLSLSSYISAPTAQLQTAFSQAQQNIMSQMTRKKQQIPSQTIKIRLQQAIKKCNKVLLKDLYFINHLDEKQSFQIECVHQRQKILDTFTLQYNAIVYTLQKECGFRVRPFLLYDQEIKNQRIFLFLNLSPQNRLRVAAKYRIKKQVDYSQIDFFLNDPCGKDGRPLKLHSFYKDYEQVLKTHKQVNRYFNIKDHFLQYNGVIQEQEYSFEQSDKFLLHTESVQAALSYYKLNKHPFLSSSQKKYIYVYNNKKINKGCHILYQKFIQRRQFFEVVKGLSEKYDFRSTTQPDLFEKFMIPSKYNKGAGYFQKLRGILLYKPQIIGPYGELDLFLKMEKIKLAYLVLKKTFKLNFLEKIGFDVFAFGSQFQKNGKGGDQKDKGGIDGENLAESWPAYTVFTRLSTIRNYCGDIVGHQISFKIYMLYFFIATLVPYSFLFIMQHIFKSLIYLGADFCKLAFISIFFRSYITLWSIYEQQFISEYQQQVPSKIFLNTYRGPYIRNIITDEVNEYQKESGLLIALKNLTCILIILAVIVMSGAIFHGCRMLLVSIYDQYYKLRVSSISFPHFFAYLLFFVIIDLLRYFATDKIIDFLVYIKNPPSDQDARSQTHNFRFFYLLGIELIAPIFFYIIEPFLNTDCYSKNCNKEIEYYVYARYIIKFGQVLFNFIKLLIFKYSAGLKKHLTQQKPVLNMTLQGRLSQLLIDSLEESDKKQHKTNNSLDLIIIIGYALYSLLLPIVVIISFCSLFIEIFNLRTSMLQRKRRPINKSQSILQLSNQLHIIFFMGILANSWMMVFSFQTIQNNFPNLILIFVTTITIELVFLLKIACTIALILILLFLGSITSEITKWAASNWLINRKRSKFKDYVLSELSDKIDPQTLEQRIPIKSIARTWNPLEMPHQMLQRILEKYGGLFSDVQEQEFEESTCNKLDVRPII